MKKIVHQIIAYFSWVNKPQLMASVVFISIIIFINYHFKLNQALTHLHPMLAYVGWFVVFFFAFAFPYVYAALFKNTAIFRNIHFIIFLFAAPLLFAWKMSACIQIPISTNELLNEYWNKVIYWPAKLIVIVAVLFVLWRLFDRQQPFYGLTTRGFEIRAYVWMLLIMIPLIAIAATQPDFMHVYPKLKNVAFLADTNHKGWYKLLYEISYGSDFLGIELFFRGFLILAFAKWVGKESVLPMALFYCTIHFGKPLGECISSFFGGIILGVVTYHTRSIYGGLMVHMGIAWLMELAGILHNFSASGKI